MAKLETTMTEKRKRGAPKGNKNNFKRGNDTGFAGRCLAAEKADWDKARESTGESLSEFLVDAANKKAQKILNKVN